MGELELFYKEEASLKDRLERESLPGARWRMIDRYTVDFEIQTRLDAGALVTVRSDAERFFLSFFWGAVFDAADTSSFPGSRNANCLFYSATTVPSLSANLRRSLSYHLQVLSVAERKEIGVAWLQRVRRVARW